MTALVANHHKDKQAEDTSKISRLKEAVSNVARQGSMLVRGVTRTDSQKSAAAAACSVEAKVEAEGDNSGQPYELETETIEKELAAISKFGNLGRIQGKSDKFDKSLIPTSIVQTDLAELQVFGMAGGGEGGV